MQHYLDVTYFQTIVTVLVSNITVASNTSMRILTKMNKSYEFCSECGCRYLQGGGKSGPVAISDMQLSLMDDPYGQ